MQEHATTEAGLQQDRRHPEEARFLLAFLLLFANLPSFKIENVSLSFSLLLQQERNIVTLEPAYVLVVMIRQCPAPHG